MAKKIIITKRFRKSVQSIYTYISEKFSSRIAFLFLDKIEDRVEFISRYPEAGKLSQKKKNIRCVQLTPHKSFITEFKKIPLRFYACLICEKIQLRGRINFSRQN